MIPPGPFPGTMNLAINKRPENMHGLLHSDNRPPSREFYRHVNARRRYHTVTECVLRPTFALFPNMIGHYTSNLEEST